MSFWKSLFTPTTGAASSNQQVVLPNRQDADRSSTMATASTGNQTAGSQSPRIFLSNNREVDLYELEALCDAVGWARRPIRKVQKAIQHSFLVVTMWREQGSFCELIGFARATSDHTFNATVWDVVVHPEYQNKGLGRALMQRVIDDLRAQDISNITLFADPGVVTFYEQLGFTPDPDGIKGMFWYPDSQKR